MLHLKSVSLEITTKFFKLIKKLLTRKSRQVWWMEIHFCMIKFFSQRIKFSIFNGIDLNRFHRNCFEAADNDGGKGMLINEVKSSEKTKVRILTLRKVFGNYANTGFPTESISIVKRTANLVVEDNREIFLAVQDLKRAQNVRLNYIFEQKYTISGK